MLEKTHLKEDFQALDYDVPQTRPVQVKMRQKLHATAIYDNLADETNELAFKKGDILTVLEMNADGWWLCNFRGQQGFCPGNRLRILNSYDSGCFSSSPPSSPSPSPSLSQAASTATLNSSICSAEIYENSSIISSSTGSGSGSGYVSNSTGLSLGLDSASHTQLNHHSQQQLHYLHHHHQQQQQQSYRYGTRRSWHASPNKANTPQTPTQQQQQQQIYSNQSIYQNVSMMSNGSSGNSDFETYDTPKPATPVNYDCPKSICRTPTSMSGSQVRFDPFKGCSPTIQEESYDVPRPLNSITNSNSNSTNSSIIHHQNTLTPSSSNSSLLTSDSLSLSFSSSNRSSLANMPDYDIPRRNPLPVRAVHQMIAQQQQQQRQQQQLQQQQQQNQLANGSSITYDSPLPSTQSTPVQEKLPSNSLLTTKELPLELSSALETLVKLQSAATASITRLLSFVSPNWRLKEKLEPVVMEVKLAAVRLRTALHDLTEFGEGALGNAKRSEDRNLALKLQPLVRALRDADKLIHESAEELDAQGGWTVENLSHNDNRTSCKAPDSLDRLIACAQTLTEDVRQTTSFIQGNASLLFKRSLPIEATDEVDGEGATATGVGCNNSSNANADWMEDYDYVSFESKEAGERKNTAQREVITANLKKKFDNVIKTGEMTSVDGTPIVQQCNKRTELTQKDKTLIRYYAIQVTTHMGDLRQAIDSFLETVEKNQPPKYFIAYGKFVVVSAYNLITIGHTVHQNLSKQELREKILRCTNALNDALNTCVNKSKKAAAQFPSVNAVQEMVDSVVDISHLAMDLKASMLRAVQQTI